MSNDVMMAAIRRRKARGFESKGFLKEPTPGLKSDDLKEKTEVTMGDGVRAEDLQSNTRNQASSTDDLSPSHQELKSKGMEVDEELEQDDEMEQTSVDDLDLDGEDDDDDYEDKPEVGGDHDAEVYDPTMIERIKARGGPKTIMERMQWDLYKKRKRK